MQKYKVDDKTLSLSDNSFQDWYLKQPFCETMIEIPKIELTKSPIRPENTAGMPLTVDILGDKRTVMNYIMIPIQKSLKTAFHEKQV